MQSSLRDDIPIRFETDIVQVRHLVRRRTAELGFSIVDQTKIVTAASELARNTLTHGKGGHMIAEIINAGPKTGIKLCFEDKGPGIPDIPRALTNGFTTGNGLGLWLGGAKRLVSEFHIDSTPGQGTRVTIARWK